MSISDKTQLPFLAGIKSNGEPVFESLYVEFLADTPQHFRLIKSPLLARNLASGDLVRQINPDKAEYELINRSGNVCIRLFGGEELTDVEQALTSKFEKNRRLFGSSNPTRPSLYHTCFHWF